MAIQETITDIREVDIVIFCRIRMKRWLPCQSGTQIELSLLLGTCYILVYVLDIMKTPMNDKLSSLVENVF